MESGIDTGWFHYDFTQCGGEASSEGKRRLIRGEGFATRISSNVRPQDPGGGAPTLAAPRRMMDIDVTDDPICAGGGGGLSRFLTDFGDVGRGGQSWEHSTFGVSM